MVYVSEQISKLHLITLHIPQKRLINSQRLTKTFQPQSLHTQQPHHPQAVLYKHQFLPIWNQVFLHLVKPILQYRVHVLLQCMVTLGVACPPFHYSNLFWSIIWVLLFSILWDVGIQKASMSHWDITKNCKSIQLCSMLCINMVIINLYYMVDLWVLLQRYSMHNLFIKIMFIKEKKEFNSILIYKIKKKNK